jgi:hypothetical protein
VIRLAPRRLVLLAASLPTLAYAAISATVLVRGRPHEDAYILFKYCDNLARGEGIVFSSGGPHAEGATDFLWMLVLAAGRFVGVDPAIGAAALNTIAFFACALLVARISDERGSRAIAFTAPLLLLITPCALASYLGFSAMTFATLAVLVARRFAAGPLRALPPLALLLGLFRPDGVLLGASFVALAIACGPFARADAVERKRFLVRLAACVAIGAAYFVWRWRYFGELLPLPAQVKSHYAGLPPGLGETADWIASTMAPLLLVGILARVWVHRAPIDRAALLALVPFVLHTASFALVVPSQNVANRFESPFALALFVLAIDLAQRQPPPSVRAARVRSAAFAIALVVAFYPQAVIAKDIAQTAFLDDYVDVFACRLGTLAHGKLRVAATEAGRVLYWTRGPVMDLVGLNTRETASRPPTRALLDDFDPDLVMFHPAGTLNEDALESGRTGDVIHVEAPIGQYVSESYKQIVGQDLPAYRELKMDNVRGAALGTIAWLSTKGDAYELYAVRFKARFARYHLYAIRSTLPEKDAIVLALKSSHEPQPEASHVALSKSFGR